MALKGGRVNEAREQAFAAAFAELRAEYALALPDEVRELVDAVGSARARLGGTARAMAHKLCGTAGSYGFSEISEAAGRLEAALKAIETNPCPEEDPWAEIHGALQRITAALAELSRPSP